MYSALLTDFYQLTMAYSYWRLNRHNETACFHLFYRTNPFDQAFAITAGLADVVTFLQEWRMDESDLAYLANLNQPNGAPFFSTDFLNYLQSLRLNIDLFAIPEGSVVFPNLPLLRVEGPLLQCQLIESALLNIINFQSLIATKAQRICQAAQGDTVLEFGLRRAQGPNGALAASRAAYIGGCDATSNTLAGKHYGIPVRGTHAHSFVSVFASELEAFKAYATVLPDNCVLLVDTYNTQEGIKNAIEIGLWLKTQGHVLRGIRLDSGDMLTLSIKAREWLDAAGLTDTAIVASNSLNEAIITELKTKGAPITVWGVGTQLVTAYDQPALDGVYKLSALKTTAAGFDFKFKLSEDAIKITNPGRHQVRRFLNGEGMLADVIYDIDLGIQDNPAPTWLNKNKVSVNLDDYDAAVDLLKPILLQGQLVQPLEELEPIRLRVKEEVRQFNKNTTTTDYPVGLEPHLAKKKMDSITDKKSHQ